MKKYNISNIIVSKDLKKYDVSNIILSKDLKKYDVSNILLPKDLNLYLRCFRYFASFVLFNFILNELFAFSNRTFYVFQMYFHEFQNFQSKHWMKTNIMFHNY